MKLAIAITTTTRLMQFIPEIKQTSLDDPDLASKLADFALGKIAGVAGPEERFTNAMVTAVNEVDQPFANTVRDWIYKHLNSESTPAVPVEVVVG